LKLCCRKLNSTVGKFLAVLVIAELPRLGVVDDAVLAVPGFVGVLRGEEPLLL
jgi:hypothetical protein